MPNKCSSSELEQSTMRDYSQAETEAVNLSLVVMKCPCTLQDSIQTGGKGRPSMSLSMRGRPGTQQRTYGILCSRCFLGLMEIQSNMELDLSQENSFIGQPQSMDYPTPSSPCTA